MSPILFVMTVVLTVLPLAMSQCTTIRCAERGYEPPRWENGALYLETLLSETSKTLLKAVEARLTEHSEAVGLRLAAQSEAMETRLTNAIADSIATMTARLEEALNARMDAIEDSKENGTKDIATKMQILAEQSTAISTRLTDQSDMMKELSKAIDDKFANMTASLEGAFNPSMDALEERKTNGTNYIATKMQALAEQSSAMETRLSDKVVALETRLAQQEGSIKAHLTRTIDEKYKTLIETLEDTIRNGTCALVPQMQGMVENRTKDLAVKFEEKVTMGVSLASNCSEHQVQRNLVQINTTVSGIVNKVEERLVTEMGNLANDLGQRLTNETRAALTAIEHRLQDNLARSNITLRDLVRSLEPLAEQSNGMETRLSGQILALQTRQIQLEGEIKTHMTRVIDERYANMTVYMKETRRDCSIRLDALQETIGNITRSMQGLEQHSEAIETRLTEQTVALETRLAQQEVVITSNLTGAIGAKYTSMKTIVDEATDDFYYRVDALQELAANEIRLTINYTAHQVQGDLGRITTTLYDIVQRLTEQSMAMETRLTEQKSALETGLAQQEGAITSAIGKKYESLTETVEESIGNGTYHIVTNVQERLVTEMGNLANDLGVRLTNETRAALTAIEHRIQDNLAHSNITIRDLVLSLKTILSADSKDARELVTKTYTNLSAQIFKLRSLHPVVFLRRMDGSVNFTSPWADYKAGFGDRGGEFWLGLDTLHALTNLRQYNLRVELTDWSGGRKWEVHNHFSVGGENDKYRLSVSGTDSSVSTTGWDYLQNNNGHQFSAIDNDNDGSRGVNCAMRDKGGWWYGACHSHDNPTGVYRPAGYTGYRYTDGGIMWYGAYNDARPFKELTLELIPV